MFETILISALLGLVCLSVYQKINNAVYKSKKRLDGKTALVTGGTSGLGLIIAQDFAIRGAKVIIACPFEDEGINARKEIIEKSGNQNVVYKYVDLSSLKTVREFAKDILKTEARLDILVNNAGVGIPGDFMTEDGINFILQVNYYAHFLLTLLLLPLMRRTGTENDPARIINMSSLTHRIASSHVDDYNRTGYRLKLTIYANSKLCLVLFARELARRLVGKNVVINCADPGFAATRIYKSGNELLGLIAIGLILLFAKTPYEGAQTAIYMGVDDAGTVTGEYFANCRQIKAHIMAYNESNVKKLWEQSMKLVQLDNKDLDDLIGA
ncbi:retinol dehydrogenase 11-like [Zerene cesonia]|uniref:retinol dehydrogenase 11-like n=1 Tax=Zerene cesonia TaxID=33412 RepID=UPI0018E4E8AC|nr:retinol dehydrogenase 11-like [Zerene cesonia]